MSYSLNQSVPTAPKCNSNSRNPNARWSILVIARKWRIMRIRAGKILVFFVTNVDFSEKKKYLNL